MRKFKGPTLKRSPPMRDHDWRAWLTRLRTTDVSPLGQVIATSLGRRWQDVAALIHGDTFDAPRFRALYELALLEYGSGGDRQPVAGILVELPPHEKVYVRATEAYRWLEGAGQQLPEPLREWLESPESVYRRWKLEKERLDRNPGVPALSPTEVVELLELGARRGRTSAEEERSLHTAWGALAALVLAHHSDEVAAGNWGFVARIHEDEPPAALRGLVAKIPTLTTLKNHVATSLVLVLGEKECERRYPQILQHHLKRGPKLR